MASQLLTGVAAQVLVHAMLEEVIVIEILIVLEASRVGETTADGIILLRVATGVTLPIAVKV